jgi:hypothetical protein
MAVTTDRQYRQLLSTAMAYRKQGLEDLVSNSDPVWNTIRENGNYRSYSGPEIRVHLLINKQDAQWFTGYDKLKNSPIELVNDAVFTPTNIAVPISFNGTELLANEGSTRVMDIMEVAMDGAEMSMRDALEVGILSDGTGSNGRQMVGLAAAVPIVTNTGTYGGISRSANAIWRTTTYDANSAFPTIGTQVDSTTIRPMLSAILAQRSRGTRAADLLIMSQEHFSALEQSMVAHQRIVNETRLGKLGFSALEFIGSGKRAQAVLASGLNTSMPANTTFGLESRSLYLYYHPSRNMDTLFDGDGAMPINQDAIAQYLVWNGQFVITNPLFSWRLYDSVP